MTPQPATAGSDGRRLWRRWSGLSKTQQFVEYTRLSAAFTVVFLGVISVLLSWNLDSTSQLGRVAMILAVAVMASAGGLTLALRPDFNTRPRPDYRPWQRIALVMSVVLWGVGTAAVLTVGSDGIGLMLAALVVFSAVVVPWWPHPWLLSLVSGLATALFLSHESAGGGSVFGSVSVLVMGPMMTGWTAVTRWSIRIMLEAERARTLEAELFVSQERLRISQELHDTMGQNLAAMSVKTELALALARRGDPRLEPQLTELQGLTQRAAAEMRAVVQGYRSINLATEVAGAQALLEAADVSVDVSGVSLDVPEEYRELAAWFVREAVTNVLRHSQATQVTFDLGPDGVAVTNDGAAKPPGFLSGLASFHRRAQDMGADLTVSHEPPQFVARLHLIKDSVDPKEPQP